MALHTHDEAQATITVVGADTENPAYVGCFGRRVDEPPSETERRWNQYAQTMWEWGLEPIEDEPYFTFVDHDGLVFDHYQLREVEARGHGWIGVVKWAIAAVMMLATSAQFDDRIAHITQSLHLPLS